MLQSEVAVFLTEKCSAAAKLTDTLGMTPLHLAVSVDDPQLAVVEDLTEVKAEAGIIRAKDGSWPLWTAINNKVHGSILKDLIVSNPESAKLMDNSTGSTPLHRAVELNLPLSVVKDLIKVYPQALEITNGDDRIPLHVAMECKPTFEVIKLLVQKYPESVELANKDGKTPHEVALQLGLDDDITSFLNPFEED